MKTLEQLTDLERIVLREALELYAQEAKGYPEMVFNKMALARDLSFRLT